MTLATTLAVVRKRIVLHQTAGERAQMMHICGTTDNLPPHAPLTEFFPEVLFPDGHVGPCCLVMVKPRYVLYREIHGPETQIPASFHPEQR